MLNLVIFKQKSENCCNMEIAQGVLGNYALVSQTFSITKLCMFSTRHWHREKIFGPFFCLKMSIVLGNYALVSQTFSIT